VVRESVQSRAQELALSLDPEREQLLDQLLEQLVVREPELSPLRTGSFLDLESKRSYCPAFGYGSATYLGRTIQTELNFGQ
jgi:hypothetical protein